MGMRLGGVRIRGRRELTPPAFLFVRAADLDPDLDRDPTLLH